MASYIYKCPDCGDRVEVKRSIYDEESAPYCAVCTQIMKKVFSSPVINLVGRGFYRNGG